MKLSEMNVLIIEDDVIFSTLLKKWVMDQVRQVKAVETAEKGSYSLNSFKPDIIFMDNALPGADGIEMIQSFKEKMPDTYIILMSSVFDVDEIAEAIERGADFLFNKKDQDEEGIKKLLQTIEEQSDEENNESIWRFFNFMAVAPKDTLHKNIMIVEDDEVFAFHITWIMHNLKSKNRHTVNSFSTAESFYKFTEKSAPDVVVLDYYLPDADGSEVLEYIRKNFPDAKVVMLSSQRDPQKAIELSERGIGGYIVKDGGWKVSLMNTMNKLKC